VVGKALVRRRLSAALRITCLDEGNYEAYTEIEVPSPARPSRGTARVGDDHRIRWLYHLTGVDGLAPQETANTIAATLTGHHLPPKPLLPVSCVGRWPSAASMPRARGWPRVAAGIRRSGCALGMRGFGSALCQIAPLRWAP
jgi:hypothetical protein